MPSRSSTPIAHVDPPDLPLTAASLRRVNVQVIEGLFVEGLAPGAAVMDRRAFGEFVGPNGELASYAIGWMTDSDHGRISVGIGRGNPGGATFHAVVFANADSYAFQLVDEPFEEVREGGPHIGADAGRAHEDLPFVWWVIDCVFARDRRALWLRHWLLETMCIETRQVFEKHEPVLLIAHDSDDGLWQLIGITDAGPDGMIGHLSHAIDEDETLLDVLDLGPGELASRSSVGSAWGRRIQP
jgi:hypothetical protein